MIDDERTVELLHLLERAVKAAERVALAAEVIAVDDKVRLVWERTDPATPWRRAAPTPGDSDG